MVINTTSIQLFQILRQKLGEQEAEALVSFVDTKIKENNESSLKTLATKEDIARLDVKIAAGKADILQWLLFSFFVMLMLAIIGLYFRK